MKLNLLAYSIAILCAASWAIPGLAFAEENKDKSPGEKTNEKTTDDAKLEEVYIFGTVGKGYRTAHSISATRTLTPIEAIPQSISVISGKLIQDQQPISIGESLRNISGIVINHTLLTPAFDNTLIRGFAAEQFVDGFTQYYNPGDRDSLINVERIEVLKGTNGLLYGGGSGTPIGGMVNIVSKMPEAGSSAELAFKVGDNQFRQSALDINQGFSGSVFGRLTAEHTTSETDIDHLDSERYNINPSLRFKPSDDSNILVRLKHSRWSGKDYQGLPAFGTVLGNIKIDPYLFIGHQDLEDSSSDFDALEIKSDFFITEKWQAMTQLRVAQSEFEQNAQLISGGGFDFGVDLPILGPPVLAQALGLGQLPFALFNAQLKQKQDEVSFVSNLIREIELDHWKHVFLIGADYSKYDDEGFINFAVTGNDFIIDLADPNFSTPYSAPGPGTTDNFVNNTVYGVYSQWQASYAERLHLLFGLRYAGVDIDFQSIENSDSTQKERVIPRVGAVLDVVDGVSVFAGFSEGMRGQPFADFVTRPEPEESEQGEIGIKFKWADTLSGQAAFFNIERSNVGVPTPNPDRDGGFGVIPEGQQSSEGFEAELLWRPINGLSIWASFSHIETSFDDELFAFADGDEELPGVPEESGRLWANYEFQAGGLEGLRIGLGMYAQTGSLISLRNKFYADDYEVYDASAAYSFSKHNFELSVKNLTNEFYYDRLNYLGGRVAPGQQRAAYVTWRYEIY